MRDFLAHYRTYHADGPWRLRSTGVLGIVVTVLSYFLRFTRPEPDLWDDVALRIVTIVLCLLMALERQWPTRWRRYYIAFSYGALVFALPFANVLTTLLRGGGVPAISNLFIMLCFLVLLTDWRNTLSMLLIGTSLAIAVYLAIEDAPRVPVGILRQLPAYGLIVLGGGLFKASTDRIEAQRRLLANQALAGSIAHEVRHPFVQLKHHLERLRRLTSVGLAPGPAAGNETARDEARQHLAGAELAVQRGLQVISMTLDELDAKPFDAKQFQHLSAAQTTRKAIEQYAYESDEARARVRLQVRGDFVFRGDETAYLFVLFNLFSNALYYVPLCPHLRITVTVQPGEVRVHDDGPGMSRSARDALFEPFATTGKVGGSGLGLAYCRRVVEAFGGEIGCDSRRDRFTEFTLRLPAVPGTRPSSSPAVASVPVTPAAPAPRALQGRTVLLVDDSAPARRIVAAFLAEAGARVVQAGHGREALERLAALPHCDAVLMDLDMPGMNGLQAARAMREEMGRATLPIVALTAHSALAMTRAAHDAGMNGFVVKPADAATLGATLAPLIDGAGSSARPDLAGAADLAPDLAGLLDVPRLEGCRRVGLLPELWDDYLPLIAQRLSELETRVLAGELEPARHALHALVGACGNAGAAALHRHLRDVYRGVVEDGFWPSDDAWLRQARVLVARTDEALRDYCARVTA